MANKTLSGAEVIIECLKREGIDTIFGYPGGSAIPMFDAILDSNIKVVLSRHEQGATHMADGYARQTGKVGVALVTSGPGATNTFTGIYTALMDSSPIVVLAAQTTTPNLGKDAFQECDTSGMTFAAVKHSYLVKDSNDLPRIMKEAFHIARTGRPGPVLIDLPKDVTAGPCTALHRPVHRPDGLARLQDSDVRPDRKRREGRRIPQEFQEAAVARGPRRHDQRGQPPGEGTRRKARCSGLLHHARPRHLPH